MKTREETVKFISTDLAKVNEKKFRDHSICHIGKTEVMAILDFIYDGEPNSEAERLPDDIEVFDPTFSY